MTIHCHKCGAYLGEIAGKIKKGTIFICKDCASPELPEFLKIFGVRK